MAKKNKDTDMAVTLILGILTSLDQRLTHELEELDTRLTSIEKRLSYWRGVGYAALGLGSILASVIYILIEFIL